MPYIPCDDRLRVAQGGATNPGELNYELTLAIRAHLRSVAPLKYAHINEVVAALDWVKGAMRIRVYDGVALQPTLHRICTNYITLVSDHDPQGFALNDPELEVRGALECCKLEFYRRVASVYEDRKIKANGDVY